MKQNIVLFIGLVWPEPTSSAAGTRIIQLVQSFVNQGYHVIFSSAAQKSPYSHEFDSGKVKEIPIELNNESFNAFIAELQPDVVVYDRYVSEEHFGWRVFQESPQTLQILDTEDLHFLRFAREKAYKDKTEISLHNEIMVREIASILRCDLTLLISQVEKEILQTKFQISPSLLYYLPFLENLSEWNSDYLKPFSERQDFVFIGNFLHEPNWQTVVELKKNIWPKIRKKLPKAKMHIFGAYCSQKVFDFHNPNQGFFVHGKAECAQEVISNAKVLLAPIPFGAGQKGKFIDALRVGTPIATTSIGAESMFENDIPGIMEDDELKFVDKSVELFSDLELWEKSQEIGNRILLGKFDSKEFELEFHQKVIQLIKNIENHRNQNFLGQILRQNASNSVKFMSLWIQEKNKKI